MSPATDVLRAAQALVRRPSFLLLSSGTLALGVAALVGTFTLADSLLLRPPPWPNHQRVVVYGGRTPGDAMRAMSPRLYEAVGLPASLLSRGIARMPETVNVVGGVHRELLRARRVDAGFLPTLGIVPLDQNPGVTAGDGVLVSHALWRRWLAGEPKAEGRTLLVDGRQMAVRGVLPPDFRFFADVDLLLPLDAAANAADTAENMTAVALLAPGHAAGEFSADIVRAAGRYAAALHLHDDDLHWYGATPVDELVARGARTSLWMFVACALLVFAVAGVNVSHLMSTRMFGRVHVTALKMVFGARGWQPWLPALTDAVAVSTVACAVGIPVGTVLVGLFNPFLPRAWLSSAVAPAPGWRVLLAVVAMTQAAVLLATAGAAMRTRASLLKREQSAMGGSAGVGRTPGRARSTTALVQVALATLLVSFGVAASSRAWRLARAPHGFDTANAVVVELRVPARAYPEVSDVTRLAVAVRTATLRLPGVDSMGWSTQLPAGPGFVMPYLHRDGAPEFIQFGLATPGGNEALGLRHLAGRSFDEGDGPQAERVAIVNEAYLRHFMSDGVGDVVRPAGSPEQSARIVGVVGDTWRDGENRAKPAIFLPLAQSSAGRFALVRELTPLYAVVRGAAATTVVRDALPRIVDDVDPGLVLSQPTSLDRIADALLATARRDLILFSTLAVFAAGLAAVGQYSVQAVEVAAARDALALRSALGASPAYLSGRVFRKALWVTLGGIGLGLLATHALQKWLDPQVALPGDVGIGVTALATFLMILVTLAAAFVPARRAASVEPWRVLRSD
ncbi:ABC transporter permease [Luteibacter sp.]|uniref:ABC transporter permease n=1 Tax=Luteibacter sp. TaxID=1886636 RepID=UPI002F417A7C